MRNQMKYSKRNNYKANYITLSTENFWDILKICENLLKNPLIYSNNKKKHHTMHLDEQIYFLPPQKSKEALYPVYS